jgi:hypothetical protein
LCDAQRQIASHCEVCQRNQEKIFLDSAKLQDEVRILGKDVSRTLTVKFDFFLRSIQCQSSRNIFDTQFLFFFEPYSKMKLIKKSREQDLNQIQQTLRALHTETTQCGKVFVLHRRVD